MTCAGGASSEPTATPLPRKKLRIRKGQVVIGEASGGYLQTSLDYTVKTRRGDNWARSFLNKLKNKKRERERSRKRGRLYQRLMSGIQFAIYKGQRLRFMSLTSSPQSDPSMVNRHFEVLVKRIRRRFPLFEYCKIRTPEGQGGVIHCVFRGPFIPQSWLSEQWNEIHGAPIVDIRVLYGDRGIASCLLGYIGHHSENRMGFSCHWVFPGFVREWTRIKRYYLRFFYFYGWDINQALAAAIFYFKQMLYWVAKDSFYSNYTRIEIKTMRARHRKFGTH